MSKTEYPARSFEQKKFLLKQLIRRDFKSRYKRTVLGVLWSMISPLCFFVTQALIFTYLFGNQKGYFGYLIIGNVVFSYFSDATTNSMFSIAANGGIISKIKVNKKMFLFSRNISCTINFLLTSIIMFGIVLIDGIKIHTSCLLLIYPSVCLFFFNMGIGYILSVLFVFFKDTQYLYSIFTNILTYFSAIFYKVDVFPENMRALFDYNPVYCYISYVRMVVLDGTVPSLRQHILCVLYPAITLIIGKIVYRLNDNKFAYYF